MTQLTAKHSLVLRGVGFWLVICSGATAAGLGTGYWPFYAVAAIDLVCVVLTLRALLPGRYQITITGDGVDLRFNTQNPGFFPWAKINGAEMALADRNGRKARKSSPCLFVQHGSRLEAVPLYARLFGLNGQELCDLINQAKPAGRA